MESDSFSVAIITLWLIFDVAQGNGYLFLNAWRRGREAMTFPQIYLFYLFIFNSLTLIHEDDPNTIIN